LPLLLAAVAILVLQTQEQELRQLAEVGFAAILVLAEMVVDILEFLSHHPYKQTQD